MDPETVRFGPGGRMNLRLAVTGLELCVRGVCGPDPRETDGVVFLNQVHGSDVLLSPSGGSRGDGMVFPRGGGAPGLRVADCLPLFLVSDEALAAAHCGWRGIASGIVSVLVDLLPGAPGLVIMGPCICPSCYEVGDSSRMAVTGIDPGGEEGHPPGRLDLRLTVRRQLEDRVGKVHGDSRRPLTIDLDECTACRPDLFHSWRRDGSPGRNLVWLRERPALQRR